MRKLYFILAFICSSAVGFAQEEMPSQEKIQALRVAFISKELELTPTEAEKFWPVYNEYSRELKVLKLAIKEEDDDGDIIEKEEKVINLRKSYRERFTSVLGQQRVNRLFGVDKRFRQLLIKVYRRQQRTGPANRPNLRRN